MNTQTQDNSLQTLITDLEENAKRLEGFNATGPAYRQRKYASALKSMDKNTAQHFAETLMHHELELQALAQPAQEPVAWMNLKSLECGDGGDVDWEDTGCIPLYTHPAPAQEWVGLSDDEVLIICAKMATTLPNKEIDLEFARAIQQALKEKNT